MGNTINDPQLWLKETNREWDMFQYPYQFSMKDKIYVSTIRDKSIIDLCVNSLGNNANPDLAGDIKEEYHVNTAEAVEKTKEELKYHLSNNILQQPINTVGLFREPRENLWVNFQRKNEFNPSHFHSGIFSFVIYADIPESIRQESLNSHSGSGNTQSRGLIQFTSQFTNEVMFFNPSKYDILIFESSHIHQVYPFYSDETRITIAGNIYEID